MGHLRLLLAFAAACIVLAADPVLAQFEFSKDTVMAWPWVDSVTLRNIGSDSISLDTVIVRLDTALMPECVIYFTWGDNQYGTGLVNRGFPSDTDLISDGGMTDGIHLSRGDSIPLIGFNVEVDGVCPLGQAGCPRETPDSVDITLVFVAQGVMDSIVVAHRAGSAIRHGSAHSPREKRGSTEFEALSGGFHVQLNGRAAQTRREGGGGLQSHPTLLFGRASSSTVLKRRHGD